MFANTLFKHLRLFLIAALALPCSASPLIIDSTSWAGVVDYFFINWTHHSGLHNPPAPAYPIYFEAPDFGDNPGVAFDPTLISGVQFALATSIQEWDTGTRGPAVNLAFTLQARFQQNAGATAQVGALVWNATTDEYFIALLNSLTANWELTSRPLTPAGDFCKLQPNGTCTPIAGFGDGILRFGYAVRIDMTNYSSQLTRAQVEFDDANNFQFSVLESDVPEPTSMTLAGAGALLILLLRRRRRVKLRRA